MKLFFNSLMLIFLALILAFTSCSDGSSSDEPVDDEPVNDELANTIPPPENLMGTVALDNGEAAVMDLQFGDIAAGARASTVSVSGKIRYMSADYIVGGLYDYSTGALDIFAKNTSNGLKFVFSGTYTETAGFSGTVKLYAADETTVLATGSASAVSATDSEKSSIRLFTGTFGGDAWGVWNGTLTATSFYGTYAGEESGSGSFIMSRSDNSLSMTSTIADRPSGTGTIIEPVGSSPVATASGNWVMVDDDPGSSDIYTGTWSGTEVDSNYDVSVPNASYDTGFLANLTFQALENAYNILDMGGSASGLSYTTITDGYIVTFDPYYDVQTGITLTGEMLLIFSGEDVVIYVDDNVSDYESIAAPAAFGTGMEITFAEGPNTFLKVSAEWIEATSSFDAGPVGTDPTWQIDSTDVLPAITLVY
ncbi:hypothetical protein [Oceanispirochaeta sp.]|uniref:hypothetical protein n=1 Tax=Oceanispirochaeta sp. TaxID=2035350 RepID=UPI002624C174|nr:hypothetical protein [Oceanispirochaeta sp.]MDA3955512.1 hypothetical protein [Oceanispirochaeta sp.]